MFLKFISQYEISTLNIKFHFPIWKCKPNPKFESEFPCINTVSYTHLTLPTNREV